MTCILFSHGYVAVDSNHVLPGTGESYISPSKLVAFDKPLPLHIVPPTQWAMDGDSIDIDITTAVNDRIHGYTVTGSTTHAAKFIEDWQKARRHFMAQKLTELEKLTADRAGQAHEKIDLPAVICQEVERDALAACFVRKYHAVHCLGHRYDEEGFTLILIGEKGCYRYRPHLQGSAVFDAVAADQGHAYGSGCEVVFEYFRQYNSHVMAVYAAMLVDPGTDGFVEVWKLPTAEVPELHRQGLWYPRTKEQIREMLKSGEEPVADLMSPKSAHAMAKMYFDAGAYLGACPEALRLHRKMATEDPALAEHSVRIFGDATDPKLVAMREVFMEEWKSKGWVMRPPVKPKSKVDTKKARPLHDKQVKAIDAVKRKRTPTATPSKRKKT